MRPLRGECLFPRPVSLEVVSMLSWVFLHRFFYHHDVAREASLHPQQLLLQEYTPPWPFPQNNLAHWWGSNPTAKITAGATITTSCGAPNIRIEFFSNAHHEVSQEPTNKAVCTVGIGFGDKSGSDMERKMKNLHIWTCLRSFEVKT